MQTSASEALKEYGLSEKEIIIYLSLLELGNATANQIADKSRLNRSTTYDILKMFIEKGIASKTIIMNVAHFEVASPEKLIAVIDDKKAKLTEAMPEFEVLKNKTVEKPVVKVYEGKNGFKTILNDIISTGKPISVISTSKVFDVMVFEFPHYITERKNRGIAARVIQEKSKQTDSLKKHDKEELRETKSLKNFNANSMMWIYDNKVAIVKLVKNEIICISIQDKTIAEDNKNMFNILWEAAE